MICVDNLSRLSKSENNIQGKHPNQSVQVNFNLENKSVNRAPKIWTNKTPETKIPSCVCNVCLLAA